MNLTNLQVEVLMATWNGARFWLRSALFLRNFVQSIL